MVEILSSTKRQIEKELSEAEGIKEKLSNLSGDRNFAQSYKLTLVEIIHIVNITISNISQSL